MNQFNSDKEAVEAFFFKYKNLTSEISKVIVGQEDVVNQVLVSIFSRSHSILEGVPGLAKTLLIKTISEVLELDFNRIQFTPDLMPSDILGAETIDKDRNFVFIKGPIFSNIILADEINRTPPKTQAALLEAMQERTVTVAGKRFELDNPFFVLATQNPIDQEGTYPLPEAQLDRFMFNIKLAYPSLEEEIQIVKNTTSNTKVSVDKIMGKEEILFFQELVKRVPVPDNVITYAVKLTNATRPNGENTSEIASRFIEWGAGPRASQFLIIAAKCNALFNGKYSPDIEDVKEVAIPILRHRLIKNFKAETEGLTIEDIIRKLL